ncbi:hypothetical protein H6F32_04725 [Anabaena sp. FACHB-1237]|nr:hypothetical protein [Anabaena sp. FACHB-1237]MBD2136906.1 hypothetical protein [Anabaena sp. FACHB-1237]
MKYVIIQFYPLVIVGKTQQLTWQLEHEQQKAARLAEKLRELGINPDKV